jgi:hypothetical protein
MASISPVQIRGGTITPALLSPTLRRNMILLNGLGLTPRLCLSSPQLQAPVVATVLRNVDIRRQLGGQQLGFNAFCTLMERLKAEVTFSHACGGKTIFSLGFSFEDFVNGKGIRFSALQEFISHIPPDKNAPILAAARQRVFPMQSWGRFLTSMPQEDKSPRTIEFGYFRG